MLRKMKPELAEKKKKKPLRSGEHKANGQRMFSEETVRTGRSGHENRKVIVITGHMTTTKP